MAMFRAQIWRWTVAGSRFGHVPRGRPKDCRAVPLPPASGTAIIRVPVHSRIRWSRMVTPALPQAYPWTCPSDRTERRFPTRPPPTVAGHEERRALLHLHFEHRVGEKRRRNVRSRKESHQIYSTPAAPRPSPWCGRAAFASAVVS